MHLWTIFHWHSTYTGTSMASEACKSSDLSLCACQRPLLLPSASKCSTSSQWSRAADSPYLISSSTKLLDWGGTLYLPRSLRARSNNAFSLGERSLRAQFRLWMVTPCLRLMLERWANSQGFALACSVGCVKGLGETNSDTHVMVIQLDSLAWTAERSLAWLILSLSCSLSLSLQ